MGFQYTAEVQCDICGVTWSMGNVPHRGRQLDNELVVRRAKEEGWHFRYTGGIAYCPRCAAERHIGKLVTA